MSLIKTDYILEVIRRLEIDALNVLRFMASNGFFANENKTKFIVLNNNSSDEKRTIQVGKEQVVQETNAKLLGVTIDEDQKWKTQIYHAAKNLIKSFSKTLPI